MSVQPVAASVSRWGDAVYQLALLIADNHADAEHDTVDAWKSATASDPTGAQWETALYAALLQRARARRAGAALPLRRHVLPRRWAALPVAERALLGLWLLRSVDGARLAQLGHCEPNALVARLAGVLAPALGEPQDEDFNTWLAGKLGIAVGPPTFALDADVRAVRAERQQRLDELAAELRDAIGALHLPAGCAEAIEAAAGDAEPDGPWWRRSPVWVAAVVAGAILLLVLVIAPWRGRGVPATAAVVPELGSPAELVQHALDQWIPQTPPEGTLHRRVWALEDGLGASAMVSPGGARGDARLPQVTDLWLGAAGNGFRLEVTRDNRTVEWMLGDGAERLDYAVEPRYSACEWVDIGLLSRTARRLAATPALQKEVWEDRLTRGSYGAGYRALRHALEASDLHSYGRRTEGDLRLIALGYTEPGGRGILLLFDAATGQLRSVREVAADGAQAAARELWRLEVEEPVEGGFSRSRPNWVDIGRSREEAILDSHCLELRAEEVVSLRAVAGHGLWWAPTFVPPELPPGIERMVLLSPTPLTPDATSPQDLRVLLVGPDRWLRLRHSTSSRPEYNSRTIGSWRVTFQGDDRLRHGELCLPGTGAMGSQFCATSLEAVATGWTDEEIVSLVSSMGPVTPANWAQLDGLFLDPRPLPDEHKQLLSRALAAALPPADGEVATEVERFSSVGAPRPTWEDPYHVPLDVLQPPAIRQRQWLRYAGGALVERRAEQTLPDGTLLAADTAAGGQSAWYRLASAELTVAPDTYRGWRSPDYPLALEMVLPLLESTEPITISTADEVLLRQPADDALRVPPPTTSVIAQPWIGDLNGRVERRVWLDPATARALRGELVLIDDATGTETLLSEIAVVAQTPGGAMPHDLLPPDPALLPAETVVFDASDPSAPEQARGLGGLFQLPERALVLPGVETTDVRPYDREHANFASALRTTIWQADEFGIDDVRRYRLPGVESSVVVRQAPHTLLGHVLRNTSLETIGRSPGTRVSEPVALVVDGSPRSAWLIRDGGSPLLVVEVDDVLLAISGPDADALRGPVAQALASMVWQ